MSVLHTLIAFIVALGVLVAFHEFGHYFVARLCGVKVLRYCLGFGSPIVSRRWGRDQTEWAIAAFPLGGYVKLLGQDPDEVVAPGEAHRSFLAQSVAKRMAIIAGGPLANLLLAIGLYWGLNLYGVEEPVARLAAPAVGTAAARAQLRAGDTVVSADGNPVRAWGDLSWQLLQAAHERRSVKLELTRGGVSSGIGSGTGGSSGGEVPSGGHRAGTELVLATLDLSAMTEAELEGDAITKLGFRLFRPSPRVTTMEAGSPAEKSGMAAGDVLRRLDGKAIASGEEFVRAMRASAERELILELDRAGTAVTLKVTPVRVDKDGQSFGRIGAGIDDRPALTVVRYGAGEAPVKALRYTWEMSIFSLKMLGRMVTGDVSWRNLSGPVTIADYAGKTARLGAVYYLNFIALVSISLGVLNLLPIPVLDGGYLLYYSLEAIRKKPVPPAWMEWGAKFGIFIVVIAMSLALFNDITRLLAG